ncbi:hypothetical protein [Streptomyces violaceusniger]|uniref:hypothetical protein n=1 Tax=Streptomyces violaceusniger TaxID=68280 RepID=UPI00381EFFA5
MIRTTYRGRTIKVLAARGKPGHVRTFINGQIISHAWQGSEQQALDWFRQIIDKIDTSGGPGNSAQTLTGAYTSPRWYEPGTFDVNPNGHATQPGGICLCNECCAVDKSWFPPLKPDACRYCHEGPDNHNPRPLSYAGPHRYTEPTDTQRVGRQAVWDEFNEPEYDEAV